MKPFNFLLQFTSGQRKGIMALFILVIIFQAVYFIVASYDFTTEEGQSAQKKEWLAHQAEIDALKAKSNSKKDTIYPFNPNYISDHKGYALGMSVAEIDRLHAFRKTGKFVNSVDDFRYVTKVSDELLAKISPYFKFPDWVNEKNGREKRSEAVKAFPGTDEPVLKEEKKIVQLDINDALEEDLVKVYGVGPYFAKKILRRRAEFGAFASMEQMGDFTDLSPEAVKGLKKSFYVGQDPDISKVNINSASLQLLARFPYFNKDLAKAIITKRSMNGKIINIDELSKINDFPVDKIKIIALYLEF
ncbi:helix-hairpin-helix domain-containing protein [Flavobacterium sp. MFBS3-15]|uniref:helix-hairpin-helix domain-containing protein n=1 Tax=Flavobacterium sp. MFBS3-15 TaxID=2989816 RepID=UPI0022356920|nr:helix-hairpin-helix domain-containing protein [Flavobacterium sp. MFBS3-15]MCW4467393.1 helix-hairpin-helix domain-containing protein [Flavobacterium sp. MFBS3-15]